MRSLFGVTVVVLGILGSAAGAHAQTFTVYDKFTGALSPALWSGFELNTNSSVVSNTEQQRAVVQPDPAVPNRFLQLGLRTGHPGTNAVMPTIATTVLKASRAKGGRRFGWPGTISRAVTPRSSA